MPATLRPNTETQGRNAAIATTPMLTAAICCWRFRTDNRTAPDVFPDVFWVCCSVLKVPPSDLVVGPGAGLLCASSPTRPGPFPPASESGPSDQRPSVEGARVSRRVRP
ncbi:hypothetical protein GCM10009547_29390 [Sporichthya brevicatena]|uniref:Uncharacterized protein n=1 Tax=Sporichthya brevicatena TaxID=171442 RepID=A0ABP3S6S1_9ACTN